MHGVNDRHAHGIEVTKPNKLGIARPIITKDLVLRRLASKKMFKGLSSVFLATSWRIILHGVRFVATFSVPNHLL